MKKYHFTSKANVEKILVEGMNTYPFHHKRILEMVEDLPGWKGQGIFLWDNKLSEVEELGAVLWQMLTKNTYTICQLEVEVRKEDLLYDGGTKFQLYHDQTFSPKYHPGFSMHDKTPASVGIRRISPDKIRIVKEYNVMSLVL